MHVYAGVVLSMSLPWMTNAGYGRTIIMVVMDILRRLRSPTERAAQVSKFLLSTGGMTLRSSGLNEMPNGTPQNTRIEVACGTENGSRAAWIEVERDGQVTFYNQNGDKSTCFLKDGYKIGSWCNASDLHASTTLSSVSVTATTSAFFDADKSVTPQPTLLCTCPAPWDVENIQANSSPSDVILSHVVGFPSPYAVILLIKLNQYKSLSSSLHIYDEFLVVNLLIRGRPELEC
jgi:hypothetical protein